MLAGCCNNVTVKVKGPDLADAMENSVGLMLMAAAPLLAGVWSSRFAVLVCICMTAKHQKFSGTQAGQNDLQELPSRLTPAITMQNPPASPASSPGSAVSRTCSRVAKPLPDTSLSLSAAALAVRRRCMAAGVVPPAFWRI